MGWKGGAPAAKDRLFTQSSLVPQCLLRLTSALRLRLTHNLWLIITFGILPAVTGRAVILLPVALFCLFIAPYLRTREFGSLGPGVSGWGGGGFVLLFCFSSQGVD